MNNEHKGDYSDSLMRTPTYFESSEGALMLPLSPIPAAASSSPTTYVADSLKQVSPLRTENPHLVSDQEEIEQIDPNDFFDVSEFLDGNISKTLSIETALSKSADTTCPLEPVSISSESKFPATEMLPVMLNIPTSYKRYGNPQLYYTFDYKHKTKQVTQNNSLEKLKCPVLECQYETQGIDHLKSHILCVHTTVRPFVCPSPECKKPFSQNSNLRTHVKKVHPGMQIAPPSQDTQHLIQKTLAPFLQSMPLTRWKSVTLKRKASEENLTSDLKHNVPQKFFNINGSLGGGIYESLPTKDVREAPGEKYHFLEPDFIPSESKFPAAEMLPIAPNIPTSSKEHATAQTCYTSNFMYKKKEIVQKSIREKLQCPVSKCHYNTQTYDSLKKHILCTHTDLLPYVCPVQKCQKAFGQNSNLHTHVKKDHPGIQVPITSEEVKNSIKDTLAPFLKTFYLSQK